MIRTFAFYDETEASAEGFEILKQVHDLVHTFAQGKGLESKVAVDFFRAVQPDGAKEALHETHHVAVRMWSSDKQLPLATGGGIEFCSILNTIIREDSSATGGDDQLRRAVTVARTMNKYPVSNRTSPARRKWPEGGGLSGSSDEMDITFRGGGLPDERREFFDRLCSSGNLKGKKYRSPMFLATSFRVRHGFAHRAQRHSL
jgi:hypothetical protein